MLSAGGPTTQFWWNVRPLAVISLLIERKSSKVVRSMALAPIVSIFARQESSRLTTSPNPGGCSTQMKEGLAE